MTRETELGVLLCELFSADALRQFLRFDQRGAAVSSQLPAIPTHVGQVHRSAVALLGDAGLVDRELFTRLVLQFPEHREAIRQVAERWVDPEGKQRSVDATEVVAAATTAATGQRSVPAELRLSMVAHDPDVVARDVVRFEICASSDCIVHWCGVGAAKVIPRDAAWQIWPEPGARLRGGIGPVAAGDVIAVVADTRASAVQTLIAEHASQIVELASDRSVVPAGEPIAVLEVARRDFKHGFRVDRTGSDFGGVLRWQPALDHPVWFETISQPCQVTATTYDCDLNRGLHVVCAAVRGWILEVANLRPGDSVGRGQFLCRQQLETHQQADFASPRTARVEKIHVRPGAAVLPGAPLFRLRHGAARPVARVHIAQYGETWLYVVHAPLPGIFLARPDPSAATVPAVGQAVEREKPLCTILGLGRVPCDVFADVYGVVTRVIAKHGEVRYGDPLLEMRVERYLFVSPFVGKFYRGPHPDAEPYVHVGKQVERGDVLCVIEKMKLENDLYSDVSGIVEEILVEDGNPVEYGQPLLVIRVGER